MAPKPLNIGFNKVLATYLQIELALDYEPKIIDTTWVDGGDYQIGEMTWDHESAVFEINYHAVGMDKNGKQKVQLKQHQIAIDNRSFAELIQKLVEIGKAVDDYNAKTTETSIE
jgi:hypothetical protein